MIKFTRSFRYYSAVLFFSTHCTKFIFYTTHSIHIFCDYSSIIKYSSTNSRDQQGKLWLPKDAPKKQPCNNNAKQKQPGCKKVQGQSEATMVISDQKL